MNVARFIARRYFKAKKKRNVIHLITKISVIGILISTAALVILLSVFNGIEQMVVKLYSDFDPSITIRSAKAKTFNQNFLDFDKIKALKGVEKIARANEEVVILKHNDKWVHAKMIGVDTSFLSMANMKKHILMGQPRLYFNNQPRAIFGAYLLDKLDAYIPSSKSFRQTITFNVPLREAEIRPNKSPLNVKKISVSAKMNYNKEVNSQNVIIPYSLSKKLLEYGEDITALYVEVNENYDPNTVKKEMQQVVGKDFEVKTSYEKNALIYKTSKTERLIVYFILLFVFILASFNLIASITMLFVEKKKDITTLYSMGMDKESIFKIFFYEGLIIVVRGIGFGLIIGYLVAFIQIQFGVIVMPNIPGESFPLQTTWKDFFMIVSSTCFLGFIISYFPTKVLVRKHKAFQRK